MPINLTQHFTLEELTVSEAAARNNWSNAPDERTTANLVRLAKLLEKVKTVLGGKPIMVNSAYRSKRVNEAVGGKLYPPSQHCFGCAADFRVPGMTPDQVVKAIIAAGVEYDQLIREYDTWTHISVPTLPDAKPRKQALIIDKAGVRPYV